MPRRSQPYSLSWPVTAQQWKNVGEMFQILFDDTNNGRLSVRASQVTSGTLAVSIGGTGITSYTVGDLLYASGTTTLSRLADVATGKVLTSGGVAAAPAWAQVNLTTMVTGILPAANGGTGFSTYVIGDLLYASSTTALSKLTAVAAGAYLRAAGTGTAPVWSSVTLPNAAAIGDLWQASSTAAMSALAAVSAGSYLRSGGVNTVSVWSTVKIPNAATTGDLWQATAASTISALASVAAGSYLRTAGVSTANVWSTLTLPNASAQGDIFISTAANAMTSLVKDTNATRYLSNTGTTNNPAWAQVNLANGVSGVLPSANGGTGLAATFVIGDVLYADTTTTLARLADVAVGSYLRSGGVGTAPLWSTMTLPNAAAQGDLLYSSATNVISVLNKDTNATRYLSNTGTTNNPAWALVNLANGVSGDLPFANLTQGSALSVLGVTGNALADVASIVAASDGNVLRRSGTAVDFGAIALGSSNAVTGILLAVNGGSGFASYAVGDILYADTTTTKAKLADVATGALLGSGGVSTAPSWLTAGYLSTSLQTPLILGGTGNTDTLTLEPSNAAGATTGSDIIFKVGASASLEGMRMANNGGLLIGAASGAAGAGTQPLSSLHIVGGVTPPAIITIDHIENNTGSPLILMRKARGTVATPTKTLSGDSLFQLIGRGWQDTTSAWTTASNAFFNMRAIEDFTSTAQGTDLRFAVTPVGSTTVGVQMGISAATWSVGSMVTPAITGVRFLCISTTGVITSSATACVGT